MTPNITDITQPARTALNAGCEGVAAINTITSVMGINLDTLRPEPCVEGYSTPGGYSCKAVRPIALAKVMSIAQMMKAEFAGQDKSLSGIGGVETGNHAAEFILLGASTVQVSINPFFSFITLKLASSLTHVNIVCLQVCTGVMLHGYGHVKSLCTELQAFMDKHGFSSIEDFRG